MSALNQLIGFAGKAADGLLTGGEIGKRQKRGQFNELLAQGDIDGAAQFALANGETQAGLQLQQQASQQRQAAEQQENTLFAQLSFALSGIEDPNIRAQAFETMKPGLARFGLDDEDFAQIPIGDANALRAFGNQFLSADVQFDNVTERMGARTDAFKAQETARSNKVGEGLRSREVAVKEANLQRGGGTITLADGTVIQTGPSPQTEAGRIVSQRGQRVSLINDTFDRAIEQVSGLTAGPGSLLAGIPGTGAKDLASTMDTLRANIGFEELQAMRDASPTGGALGQVTEKEIAFLQAVMGSLEQSQSPEQLRDNLSRAKGEILSSWSRILQAYEQDFGVPYEGPGANLTQGAQTQPTQNSNTLTEQEAQELEQLRREFGINE